jgi:MYXO-CTERM domain-containing protein
MTTQAEHYRDVLDTQLARPWYTKSFFYEILDSGDALDGFGIVRDQGSGTYLKKTAFTQVKARIAGDPRLRSGSCVGACTNGLDDDGDGLVDLADPGCADSADTNEADDPLRKQLVARRGAVVVDGDLAEWADAQFALLTPPGDYVTLNAPAAGVGDASASFALRWDAAALYLAIRVTDEAQVNPVDTAVNLWQGDSVQAAFDMGANGGTGYDTTDDYEYGWGIFASTPSHYRWYAPPTAPVTPTDTFSIVRNNTTSTTGYEIRIPAADLGVTQFAMGRTIRFSLIVNDRDTATPDGGTPGRDGFLQWTPGLGLAKRPLFFGDVLLADMLPDGGLPDAGLPDAAPHDAPKDAPRDGWTPGSDATPQTDSAADAGGGTGDSGCGCRTGGAPTAGLALLGLVLALALRRRR